jgi:Bacteriophytochrome (light-regulated signal transduction histidine kinase)
MQKSIALKNEQNRLAVLREYNILDTGSEKEYEDLTILANEICQTPFSLISIIDEKREWIKAGAGLPVSELPRKISICANTINSPTTPLVISDLRRDRHFRDHPLVKAEPFIVFYAGIPLTNREGYTLGTICVMDTRTRTLSDVQIGSLKILSGQVMNLLELRKARMKSELISRELEANQEELQNFTYVISHDIKSPLSSIVLSSEMLRENFGDSIDEGNDQLLNVLNRSAFKIRNLVDGVLTYYRSERAMREKEEIFHIKPFLLSLVEMVNINQTAEISIPDEDAKIKMNKAALEQILIILVQSALKNSKQEMPKVLIGFSQDNLNYYFSVSGNQGGTSGDELQDIAELFKNPASADKFGTNNLLIGLSAVKKAVEKMQGRIEMKPEDGHRFTFSFNIKKEL